MKKLIGLCLVIVFGLLGLFVSLTIFKDEQTISASPQVRESRTTAQKSNTIAVEEKPAVGIPTRISIPSLKVNAVVEQVGTDSKGRMDIPKNWNNTGWYKYGVRPGENGSAVIDGHVDTPQGKPSVFANVTKLTAGDSVTITDDLGKAYEFSVTEVVRYPLSQIPLTRIFDPNLSKPHLNLITCAGTWDKKNKDYSDRVVVYATLRK